MKIALTGGTGLLGGVLVPRLLADGHTLRVLARPLPGRRLAARSGVQWISGRLDQAEALDELVHDADVVLHAAYQDPGPSPVAGRSEAEHWVQTNYVGSTRLLERTAATRAHQLIYVSSLAVYSADPNADPLGDRFTRDETFPVWPLEFYGAIRAGVEKMVITAAHAYHWNTSVFRFGYLLGPRARREATPFARTVDEAIEHGEIRTQHGGYVLGVEDAADILAGAVGDTGLAARVFNVFDRWYDFAEVAPTLSRLLGREVKVAAPPAREPRSPIRGDRIRERHAHFRTEETIEALLTELVGRRAEL